MTLKDTFEMTMISFLIEKKQDANMLDHFQKIAEQFAIEFAEWCNSEEAEDLILDLILVGELDKKPTTKQLLEQFKKEKGYE
jgi:hypothetical protein